MNQQPVEPDITLSTGRVIVHVRQPNGSQLAMATTGSVGLTEEESQEYDAVRAARAAAAGHVYTGGRAQREVSC